ncbi:hypothetical protein [Mycobacteroides abscessus]|uniref:hypothetical protein n=1 Tax=Mycobacteroides abscessus TaxID=36809 RepID=UPI0012FF34DE|nr:hypothetical protein [Mycobacteroides abscessus]
MVMSSRVARQRFAAVWAAGRGRAVQLLPMAVCGSLGALVAAEVPTTAAPYIAGAAFGVLLWASTTTRCTDCPERAAVPMGRALAVRPGERVTVAEVIGRARHEAGHAVLAYHHGIGLANGFVSSSPSAQVGGQIRYAVCQRVTTWHDEWVRIQLAWGGEAVQRVDGHRLTSPSTYDAAAAHRSAEHLYRMHADLGFAYRSAHELSGMALDAAVVVVRSQPAAVDAVAALLVAHADQHVDGELICAAIGAVWLPYSEGSNE